MLFPAAYPAIVLLRQHGPQLQRAAQVRENQGSSGPRTSIARHRSISLLYLKSEICVARALSSLCYRERLAHAC